MDRGQTDPFERGLAVRSASEVGEDLAGLTLRLTTRRMSAHRLCIPLDPHGGCGSHSTGCASVRLNILLITSESRACTGGATASRG